MLLHSSWENAYGIIKPNGLQFAAILTKFEHFYLIFKTGTHTMKCHRIGS